MTVTDMVTPTSRRCCDRRDRTGARTCAGRRVRRRRSIRERGALAAGAVDAIAGGAGCRRGDRRRCRARAVRPSRPGLAGTGVPGLGTPHLTPQEVEGSILGSFLKSQGSVPDNPTGFDGPYWQEAASHAYAFSTYWGTGYTFEKHDRATGYTVCSIYPDYQTTVIPDHGGWVGGCSTAATLAEAAAGWQTVRDPNGLEFVQLVPAGTTAQMTPGNAPAKAVPVKDGVLSVRVTSPATLTVHSGSSTQIHQLDPRAQPLGSTSSTFPVPSQPGGHASSTSGGRADRAPASSQP